MRVVSRKVLRDFWEEHPAAEQPLKAWFAEATKADWKGPADIKARYAHASIISSDRVVFNVGGNNYRVVVVVKYRFGMLYVRFVGTHAEYDRIDASKV